MEEQNKTLKQQSKGRGKESTLVLIDAERRTIDESWQIFNPKHKFQLNLSVFTLSKPLSPNPKSKRKKQGRKTEWKRCPKQNRKKGLTAAGHQVARPCHVARLDRATWHGRAPRHGQPVPIVWPAGRAGSLAHGRAVLAPVRVSPVFAHCLVLDAPGFLEPLLFF